MGLLLIDPGYGLIFTPLSLPAYFCFCLLDKLGFVDEIYRLMPCHIVGFLLRGLD